MSPLVLPPDWANRVTVHAQERLSNRFGVPALQTGPLLEYYRERIAESGVYLTTSPIIEDGGQIIRLVYSIPSRALEHATVVSVTDPPTSFNPKRAIFLS